MKFNAIGAMGVGVQLLSLVLITRLFHLNYLFATLIAVQFALVHNFFWHQRWTWKDSKAASRKESLKRFMKFNSSSGAISMLGNLGFTAFIAHAVHLPYLASNLAAIGATNIANFVLARNFVFQPAESI
ncbi:MAG TPA: GtrA family protein [Acidobacteriota bacterium]|nr:GtrA family protein [Acidobacteriota bacterium]